MCARRDYEKVAKRKHKREIVIKIIDNYLTCLMSAVRKKSMQPSGAIKGKGKGKGSRAQSPVCIYHDFSASVCVCVSFSKQVPKNSLLFASFQPDKRSQGDP